MVLQACHTEPAIKHAVLALSSLHQLSGLPNDSDTAYQHRLYAEKQHHKALAEARGLIASAQSQDVDRILIACVIFIIFEGVHGDYRAAAMHMDSGRAIVAQNSQRLKHTTRRRDLIEIEHALARLDLPAICFTDRSSPYRYNLTDFYQTNPILSIDVFQDVGEAQASFVDLMRWLLVLSNHIDAEHRHGNLQSMARYQAEKNRCGALFEKWNYHFQNVVGRADPSASPMILNLRIWQACAALIVTAETYGSETRYDSLMHYFQLMIEYGERLAEKLSDPNVARSFSFDLGYTIPIYFTATRCRDPKLRRRAVALLKSYPRQEGVWESVAAATVASRWIDVEEEGLGEIRSAADVPEYKRIRYIDTEVDIESKVASVKLTASDVDGPVEVFADWKQADPDTGTPGQSCDSKSRLMWAPQKKRLPWLQKPTSKFAKITTPHLRSISVESTQPARNSNLWKTSKLSIPAVRP